MYKNLKLLFLSGNIARQGKSTQSITCSQYTKLPFFTNDRNNSTKELYEDVQGVNIGVLNLDKSLGELDEIDSWIFDAGGFEEINIPEVIKRADKVIYVFSYQSSADYIEFYKSILKLEKVVDKQEIIILLNNKSNTEKKIVTEGEGLIKESFPNYEIFTINHSRYFWQLPDKSRTIFDVANSNKRDKGILEKSGTIEQLEKFYNHLTK